MSLGFDSISENPISALTADAGFSAAVESGQGSQMADAALLLKFIATITAEQGSQTADVVALLQFIMASAAEQGTQTADAIGHTQQLIAGAVTAGQASEEAAAVALQQFIAAITASQALQTGDALGVSGNGIIATCDSGQGDQTADCVGEATGGIVYLDGVGVGRGNKSWWHDKEVVVDHRIRHKGNAKVGQAAQGAEAIGGVRNPFTMVAVMAKQAPQTICAVGDVTDPELEEFAMMAAAMLDGDWREAA
jgi:hypothetical protein